MPYLHDFESTDGSDRDLLGGKGAGLARMTTLGLPVPPGFTITTEVCRLAMRDGRVPADLWEEVDSAVQRLEEKTGRAFGGGPVPMLLSVRSGARFSMPGMMDTILNLGINDQVVTALTAWSGDDHFAWDVHRRFVQMYGDVVLGVDSIQFQEVLTELRESAGVADDSELSAGELETATRRFQAIVEEARPGQLPADPMDQLKGAITAVFESWNTKRAIEYRRINSIPDDLGTAANVQMMVFGDLGDDSGTGVCFTRDPSTGSRVIYGDYLPRAQGEDVVAGIRNTLSLDELAGLHPNCHQQLIGIMEGLETHYRDMCDIEFTIEKDVLYILQTRAGKRTAPAAVRMAVGMVDEGLIDRLTAVGRVDPASLEQLHRPRIADHALRAASIARGVAASPGAATGAAVFSSEEAVARAREGEAVILVRSETTPDDIHGMAAALGILTSQGGKTSHAAVVARGMGKPAVTGVAALTVDATRRQGRGRRPRVSHRRGDNHRWHQRNGIPRGHGPRRTGADPGAKGVVVLGRRDSGAWGQGQRRYRGRCTTGAGTRRRRDRSRPDRAHVPRRTTCGRPGDHPLRRSPEEAGGPRPVGEAPDRGLRGLARGHGRAPGGHQAPRPSPSRVPSVPSRPRARDAPSGEGGTADRRPSSDVRPGRQMGRGQSHAGPSRGPARADGR